MRGLRVFLLLFLVALPAPGMAEELPAPHAPEVLRNNIAYSYNLMNRAANNPESELRLLEEALKASPDFPPVYFRLAAASLSHMPHGLFTWSYYFVEGLKAYARNWWWWFNLTGLALLALVVSFVGALLAAVAIRFPKEFPLLKHDVREKRRHMVLFGVLLAAAALGPLFFLSATLLVFGLYFRRKDKLIIYIVFLSLAALPWAADWLGLVYNSSRPELRAVIAVNEERDNGLALEVLPASGDFEGMFSYGHALRYAGRVEEAVEAFGGAIDKRRDYRAYINLGNMHFLQGRLEAARLNYEEANEIRPSASAYFNLSRLNRDLLDFETGDLMYRRAVELDPEAVSQTVKLSEGGRNRLMYEYLDRADFLRLLKGLPRKGFGFSTVSSRNLNFAAALLFIAFFAYYASKGRTRAYRCSRCSRVMCPGCEREAQWGQMCRECYQSLIKLEAVDPKERVSRLLMIHGQQVKREALLKTLSFAPPGIAHLYAGRVLWGMLFLWAFLFFALILALNPYFSTGLFTFGHGWLDIAAFIMAVLLYVSSFWGIRRRQGQGWL